MKKEMCDHFWEYKEGSKKGVNAVCVKCNSNKLFSWPEWKKMLRESHSLGTSRF